MGTSAWWDDGFIKLVRDHREEILSSSNTTVMIVPNVIIQSGIGDALTVFNQLGIEMELWSTVLLLNQLPSPSMFDTHINKLIVPDREYINKLHTIYTTSNT